MRPEGCYVEHTLVIYLKYTYLLNNTNTVEVNTDNKRMYMVTINYHTTVYLKTMYHCTPSLFMTMSHAHNPPIVTHIPNYSGACSQAD